MRISEKSYAVAVSLCMIFGLLGVHHFYTGNWLLGVVDVLLFVLGISLLLSEDPTTNLLGVAVLVIDGIHTAYVTIRLFGGKVRDSEGAIIAYPGQFNHN